MEIVGETTGPRRIATAAAVALTAALAGGVAWALIVRATDYEIGLVAWGIGWLAGTAALAAGRGVRGTPVQVVALVAALLGILLGKYLSFGWALQESAREVGMSFGLFSSEMRTFFRESLGDVFGWMDLLFVGLAVSTAWRIPSRPELPPAREPSGIIE
jgi:hypothetical protein